MNPKKRKAEEDEEDCVEVKPDSVEIVDKNETGDIVSNSESTECGNSTDRQKSDNGGASSMEPGTSDNSSKEIENDTNNSSTEIRDSKHIKLETSKKAGTLLFCGGTNWDLIGRKELPKNAKDAVGRNVWGPERIAALNGIRVEGVFSGSTAVHSVIVAEGGVPYTWGRNDKGQLGQLDTKRRDEPTIVDTLKDHKIISAACGRSHTLFLSDRGVLFSTGDNKMGQLGIGTQNNTVNIPTKVSCKGRTFSKVACGAEFSMAIDTKMGLFSWGCPEYGQLGFNSDGKYFVTSNKLSFRCELTPRRIIAYVEKSREGHVTLIDDVSVVDVACGINHSVAVDIKKRCFSWGFGGYGRLGHAETRDEMVPRLVKSFDGPNRGVTKVFAGGTYSMAINEFNVLYFWGQHKRAGEASMYPKHVPDLIGWCVREVGCCNCSIVCVADDTVVSWGPSPCYGELGYGENKPKSSTTPQEVKLLAGIHVLSLACGYAQTFFIARDETEEDKKKLNQLPEYSP